MPEYHAGVEDWLELTHAARYYTGLSRLEIMAMKKWEIEAELAHYVERKREENKPKKT